MCEKLVALAQIQCTSRDSVRLTTDAICWAGGVIRSERPFWLAKLDTFARKTAKDAHGIRDFYARCCRSGYTNTTKYTIPLIIHE
ncbi:hypothetical protein WA026_009209 [Henosepilachna vigintioctopunctata]|uniref:Uncharacterized protein n=1 Tax=Henosepilachna vigintioctopunctata TaxID=420089 RepID=A0AAW1UWV5_9CUCU